MATEKTIEKVEHALHAETSSSDGRPVVGLNEENLPDYNDKETKRILHKVDYRLLPMLGVLYLLCFIDKGNIGNAKVAGMQTDLKMSGGQYNLALMIFFIPYCLFEIPSNMVLKVLRPSLWLAILLVAWGTVMTLHGVVQTGKGLIGARFVLGLTEAGFFPAASFLLGEWYCRFELQRRMAMLFVAASLSGATSGLLGFALEKMDGIGNLAGWRWIFIIEGIATVVVGMALPWTLPDSPETASFLTAEEKRYIKTRLEQDAGTSAGRVDTNDKYHWTSVKKAMLDWKLWFTIFVYWGDTVAVYSFTFTAPTIILELGYTAAKAQLLTIPIYVFGALCAVFNAYLADKRQVRWPFIVGPYTFALVGFLGVMATPKTEYPGLVYFWLFFIPGGVYSGVSTLGTWVSNNLSPTWKRAVGIGICNMVGNAGGLVGSNIYIQKQAPQYWTGYGISLGFLLNAIACTFVLRYAYKRINDQRDRMSVEEIHAKYTQQELIGMGNDSPLYRYVL